MTARQTRHTRGILVARASTGTCAFLEDTAPENRLSDACMRLSTTESKASLLRWGWGPFRSTKGVIRGLLECLDGGENM